MSQIGAHLPLSSMQTIGHTMGINPQPLSSAPNVNSTALQSPAMATSATASSVNAPPTCCLLEDNQRCHRIAGNASYSKRIEKQVTQRKLRLTVDQRSHHSYICEHHKQMIQSMRSSNKRKRKDTDDEDTAGDEAHPTGQSSGQDVDLLALQVNTLRRYKKHYRIQTRPGLNKSQLAEVLTHHVLSRTLILIVLRWQSLQRHFKSMPIYEKEAITYFIYMVKCNKNKLDHNPGGGKSSAVASD